MESGIVEPGERFEAKIYDGGDRLAMMREIQEMEMCDWAKVLESARYDKSLLAFLALWPKFFNGPKAKEFYEFLAKTRGERLATKVPFALDGRSGEELNIILPNLIVWQMTYGCSQACAFCDVAAPLPRLDGVNDLEHMPIEQVQNLFKLYFGQGGGPETLVMPYWASEPLDHPNMAEFLVNFRTYLGEIGIVTHLPEGKERNCLTLIRAGIGVRISVTGRNYQRVRQLAIEVTGRDLFAMDALSANPIPMDNSGDFSIRFFPDRTIEIHPQPKRMELGANMMKNTVPPQKNAFGCQNGVMMTPLGLYNKFVQGAPTANYPIGDILVPLEELRKMRLPAQYIGRPVEELLKNFVVAANYPDFQNNVGTELYINDSCGWAFLVKIEKGEAGGWVVQEIMPYGLEENVAYEKEVEVALAKIGKLMQMVIDGFR